MNVLVLSGGGALGAIQVGALLALTEKGACWSRISGVSVGAINGAVLAMHPPTPEGARAGALELEQLWRRELSSSASVYTPRAGGAAALLAAPSINETEPLRRILRAHWSAERFKRSGIVFSVGAVSLLHGKYRATYAGEQDFVPCLMASSSFPVALPPETIQEGPFRDTWTDGGVRHVLPHAEVWASNPTHVDAILCGTRDGATLPSSLHKMNSGINVAMRCAEIMAAAITAADVVAFEHAGHIGITRRLIAPPTPPTFDSLNFAASHIDTLIRWGYELAAAT
jgi:NTE family protein